MITLIQNIFQKKKRYILNTDSLQIQQFRYSKKQVIRFLSVLFILICCLSLGVNQLYSNYFSSPKERLLLMENQTLIDQFNSMYEELNQIQIAMDSIQNKDDHIYRALLNKDAIQQSIRHVGTGGVQMEVELSDSSNKHLVQNTATQLKKIANKIKITEQSYVEILKEVNKSKKRLKHIPAIMPIKNESLQRTGSGFGMRFHPILNITRMHEGLDFIAPKGTDIYATANGVVKQKYRSTTFGNVIILDHGFGYETLYAHLSKYNVELGQQVQRGHLIGFMGSTGLSSGVHLHYEVHLHGKEIDPVHYFYNDLSPEQYQQIIKLADSYSQSLD